MTPTLGKHLNQTRARANNEITVESWRERDEIYVNAAQSPIA